MHVPGYRKKADALYGELAQISPRSALMPGRRIHVDRSQRESQRRHDRSNESERPEHIDIGQQIDLSLQRLRDVTESLSCCIRRARSLRLKEAGHRRKSLLIADIGRHDMLDQTALMKLLALRQQIDLVERFAPLARAGAHAIVQLTEAALHNCLLELSEYRERVDGEHYQPVELRERLQLTALITATLWDTNASVAAAGRELLRAAAR